MGYTYRLIVSLICLGAGKLIYVTKSSVVGTYKIGRVPLLLGYMFLVPM